VENGFATHGGHSHCHGWLILQAMPRAVTCDEETHYTLTVLKLIYTVLLTKKMCFTVMANAPYQLCHLWIGSQLSGAF